MLLFLTECVFQGSPDLGLEYPGYKEETETQRERKKKKTNPIRSILAESDQYSEQVDWGVQKMPVTMGTEGEMILPPNAVPFTS